MPWVYFVRVLSQFQVGLKTLRINMPLEWAFRLRYWQSTSSSLLSTNLFTEERSIISKGRHPISWFWPYSLHKNLKVKAGCFRNWNDDTRTATTAFISLISFLFLLLFEQVKNEVCVCTGAQNQEIYNLNRYKNKMMNEIWKSKGNSDTAQICLKEVQFV